MKVLITGAKGFIGKNLSLYLANNGIEVLGIDLDNLDKMSDYLLKADFIVHLAGVNRPLNDDEFYDGNVNSLIQICNQLTKYKKKTPILLSSSAQAEYDNPYGKSKKQVEDYLFKFQKENNIPVYIYRFDNVFGKWCRPNYNSVVATFCYNIANNLPIKINDKSAMRSFIYIDDICETIYKLVCQKSHNGASKILKIKPAYKASIGDLADKIQSFKDSRINLYAPKSNDPFMKKLYATYLSYLAEDDFSYSLNPHVDSRGAFIELLKSKESGQLSVNIIKSGITKGNHYHHTKNEKFIVVSGTCVIKFRKINDTKVLEYKVDENNIKVVDIPVGYTHSIKNIGEKDAVVIMWASEEFNPKKPDTIYELVEREGE